MATTRTLTLAYRIVARDETAAGVKGARRGARGVKTEWEKLRSEFKSGLEIGDRLGAIGNRASAMGRNIRAATGDLTGMAREAARAQDEVFTLVQDGGQITRDEIAGIVQAQTKLFGQGENAQVDQAKALYSTISAGASDATTATEMLTAANRLSVAGLSELVPTVNVLSKAVTNFGVDSTRASDVLFQTVRDGQLDLNELAAAMPKVAATADLMGLSFEETTAALALLSKTQGSVKEGSTSLKAALSNIAKPTKDASKEAKRARIEFDKEALAEKGLVEFTNDLVKANEELVRRGKKGLDLTKLFGSVEAVNAFASLTKQAGALTETAEKMRNSAGATASAFETMSKGAAFEAAKVEAEIGVLKTSFGEALVPVMSDLGKAALPLVERFSEFARRNPEVVATMGKAIIAFGAFATVLGPLAATASILTTTFTLGRAATRLLDTGHKRLTASLAAERGVMGGLNNATSGAAGKVGNLATKATLLGGIAFEVVSIIQDAIKILEAQRGIEELRQRQQEGGQELAAGATQNAAFLASRSDAELKQIEKASRGTRVGTFEERAIPSLLNSLSFGALGDAGTSATRVQGLERAQLVQEVARREREGKLGITIKIDSSERATVEKIEAKGLLNLDTPIDVGGE